MSRSETAISQTIKHQVKAVYFDLDGTLLDTAPDMALALNIQLEKHRKAALPYPTIRPWVSHGAAALIKLGFGIRPEHSDFDSYRLEYLEIYQANLSVNTQLFSGMEKLLKALETRQIRWGVVTNKPEFLTIPLLKDLNLYHRSSSVISGDTIKPSKPSPTPLFLACSQDKVTPNQAIYVGDAIRDIHAAKSAGMLAIAAKYGYINPEDNFSAWPFDLAIASPEELFAHLNLS
ncbi:HAD-IA family hydrolase [Kangiella sp. TOML190]|uniref:HAD-IA family hydrolase n=1 Tax=Kangiella sp. TOML190 TaxID=2931351 RepID=UPI00203CA1D7|nr:HAD-IA family hydrolase [Kangiella sp. TOML190]